jgi:hypothetical protein
MANKPGGRIKGSYKIIHSVFLMPYRANKQNRAIGRGSALPCASSDDHSRLCLSQIKSEYIGDAARPGLEGEEYALPSEPCAIGAHFSGRERSSNA